MPDRDKHVHCYSMFPSGQVDHCLFDVVLGPEDQVEVDGKTYHALVEFGADMCLKVKVDKRGAQVATLVRPDVVDTEVEALAGAGA